MLNHPNLASWPLYTHDETEAVMQTLQSGKVNYWTGDLGKTFESAYANHTHKKYGIALSNGTVALELALRAFNISDGDEVIVASRSYVASASCVLLIGATPVFADIDLLSGNISAATIVPLITAKTKAIIPVHIGGLPCEMPAIMQLAKQHNLAVIEDCAQAHGASIDNRPVGSWGDAAIFSFCQDKIISTGGEGGMLVLDDDKAYKKAWSYKDIGRDYDAVYHQQHSPGFRWLTHHAGSNFRMTEMQAAIGLKQLHKLPLWIEQRQAIAKQLMSSLSKFDWIRFPSIKHDCFEHAYYRTYGVIYDKSLSSEAMHQLRNHVVDALNQAGVPCFVGTCSEIYREQAFVNVYQGNRLPNATIFSERAFCLLCHHTITTEQVLHVCALIEHTLNNIQLNKC